MITINLLPQEFRKKERTPFIILLPLLGGLVCVLSAAAVAAYVHFAWLAETTSDREILEQDLAQKQPRLRHEENLLAEEAEYKKRADHIKSIADGRILMTKILDEFCEVTVQGSDLKEDGFLIWLNELNTAPPKPQRGRAKAGAVKSGGELIVKGYAVADQDPLHDYNRYHASLENSRLFSENFLALSDPKGKINVFGDEKQPRKGWTIDLTMTLKDPAEARKQNTKNTLLADKSKARAK